MPPLIALDYLVLLVVGGMGRLLMGRLLMGRLLMGRLRLLMGRRLLLGRDTHWNGHASDYKSNE
jgi:hypothetical protein